MDLIVIWEDICRGGNQMTTSNNMAYQQATVSQEIALDFPKKTPRLEGLITNYCNDNGVPVLKVPDGLRDDFSANVVADEIKEMQSLTSDEQREVMKRIEGMDYTVSSNILNFGSTNGRNSARYADAILSRHASVGPYSVSGSISKLIATLKSNNSSFVISQIASGKVNKISNSSGMLKSLVHLAKMKRMRTRMHKALVQREKNVLSLRELEIEMENQRITLEQEIRVYEQMLQDISKQVKELEFDYIALGIMIKDAESKKSSIEASKNVAALSLEMNQKELSEIRKLEHAIDNMQRKRNSILTMRVATLQTVTMLYTLVNGNGIICEKINEVVELLIPLWSWQYAIAVGTLKQQEALSIQANVRKAIPQLLVGNAKALRDNIIAVQNEMYKAALTLEDLQIVQTYIEDMVGTVQVKTKEKNTRISSDIPMFI